MKKQHAKWPQLILGGSFFALLALGQLQRLNLTANIAIYVHDLYVGIFLLWQLVSNGRPLIERYKKLRLSRIGGLLAVVVLIGWGGAYIRGDEIFVGLLYCARLVTYALFADVFVQWWRVTFPSHASKVSNIQIGLLDTGSLICFWGFLQYWLIPDLRILAFLGWDDHYYRLSSTLLDPNFTGILLVLTLWLLVNSHCVKAIKLVGTGLLILAIGLTFSRATYLALLVSGLCWLILQKRVVDTKKILGSLIILTVLGSSGYFLVRRGGEGLNLLRVSTITARYQRAAEALSQLTPTEWLIGRGLFVPLPAGTRPPSIEVSDHAKVADNLVVLSVTSIGMVGTALIVAFAAARKRSSPPLVWWLSFCAVLVHSQFNNTLFHPWVWLWLWLLGLGSKRN